MRHMHVLILLCGGGRWSRSLLMDGGPIRWAPVRHGEFNAGDLSRRVRAERVMFHENRMVAHSWRGSVHG